MAAELSLEDSEFDTIQLVEKAKEMARDPNPDDAQLQDIISKLRKQLVLHRVILLNFERAAVMTGFDPPTHMPSLRKLATDGHDFMVALARKQIRRRSAEGVSQGGGGEEAAAATMAPPERAETGGRPKPKELQGRAESGSRTGSLARGIAAAIQPGALPQQTAGAGGQQTLQESQGQALLHRPDKVLGGEELRPQPGQSADAGEILSEPLSRREIGEGVHQGEDRPRWG